jgi:tetraacyldisaccharide 4'-kinase
MELLKRKIEMIMTKEATAPFSSALEFILYLCSLAYGVVVRIKASFYKKGIIQSKRLPCKVISIGNLTVGGTGKTPLTMYIGNLLKKSGYQVVIISRGYGGSAEKTGGIVSNGKMIQMAVEQAGDEPYLIATRLVGIPVVVGSHRYQSGKQAILTFNPDILLLDDAFQHIQLQRDLNLCLCDAKKPFGNGYLIPRGTLREPVAHLRRADAVILNHDERSKDISARVKMIQKYVPRKPIFSCFYRPIKFREPANNKTHKLEILTDREILAFSGIAKNNKFVAMLSELGGHIVKFIPFPDHHWYSNTDVIEILKTAKDLHVDYIVTTEKDYVRIGDRLSSSFPTLILVISLSFGDDTEAFENFVKRSFNLTAKTQRAQSFKNHLII